MKIEKTLTLWTTLINSLLYVPSYGIEQEDCELHKPAMDDYCCDVQNTSTDYVDCIMEWHDLLDDVLDENDTIHHYCIAECSYNATDYIHGRNTLNMDVVKEHLEEEYFSQKNLAIMIRTMEKCNNHAKSMLVHKEVKELQKKIEVHNCHPFAGLVMECVTNELIMNCPKHEWSNTPQCQHAREYLQHCIKN